MSDLMREVDEAMRTEKFTRLWKEHGSVIMVGIAALILGTAAHAGWNAWNAHKKMESTTALLTALQSPQPLSALEASPALHERSPYKALPAMSAAALALQEKKYPEAMNFYTQVIADKKAPAALRDLAIVQKASLSLDLKPEMTAQEFVRDLESVAGNDASMWQGQALMTRALVKAHKAKDIKGAVADLQRITARPDFPSSLRSRAQALIDVYKLKEQS